MSATFVDIPVSRVAQSNGTVQSYALVTGAEHRCPTHSYVTKPLHETGFRLVGGLEGASDPWSLAILGR
jgi:hypothetical protein